MFFFAFPFNFLPSIFLLIQNTSFRDKTTKIIVDISKTYSMDLALGRVVLPIICIF